MDTEKDAGWRSTRERKPSIRQSHMDDLYPVTKAPTSQSAKARAESDKRKSSTATESAGPSRPSSRSKTSHPSSKAAKSSAWRGGIQHLRQYEFNGDMFRVGDCVYLVNTEDSSAWPEDDDADDTCESCKRGHSSKKGELLECSRCLCAYHTGCLKPKLKELPEV